MSVDDLITASLRSATSMREVAARCDEAGMDMQGELLRVIASLLERDARAALASPSVPSAPDSYIDSLALALRNPKMWPTRTTALWMALVLRRMRASMVALLEECEIYAPPDVIAEAQRCLADVDAGPEL